MQMVMGVGMSVLTLLPLILNLITGNDNSSSLMVDMIFTQFISNMTVSESETLKQCNKFIP